MPDVDDSSSSSRSGASPYRSKPSTGAQAKVDAVAKNMKECKLEECAQLYFKYVKLFDSN
jgi:uncharacterized protein YgbK (DUF1537 family)